MKNTTTRVLNIHLSHLGNKTPDSRGARHYLPVSKQARQLYNLEEAPFSSTGNLVFADFFTARLTAARINQRQPPMPVRAGILNAAALLHEIAHVVCAYYRQSVHPRVYDDALRHLEDQLGEAGCTRLLLACVSRFPPPVVQKGSMSAAAWLAGSTDGIAHRYNALEELMLLRLANENPAFGQLQFLFDDSVLRAEVPVDIAIKTLESSFKAMPGTGPGNEDLLSLLRAPMRASPDSLSGQLAYIRSRWGLIIGEYMRKLLGGVDMLAEEEKPVFHGPGPSQVLSFEKADAEYEAFSQDKDWMPRVVMIAKSTLVWLHQLSVSYNRPISTLDAIPDQELDLLASRGFNALWLIGLWERSDASRRIKELCGNPEAAASAYALFDYEIAGELGGWAALEQLRHRAGQRGIRLAADMVPNHTGMDSEWVRHRPELFVQRDTPPFPGYTFNGENLSRDPEIGLWLEDHYYSRSDASVVFKRVHFPSGHTTYMYHGNDGTSMPWNDTAQIDFLKPEARAAVIERILHVARNFPIIRFDAAMIMAKRHFRRLWYPEPGQGGDIASRGEYAMSRHDFDAAMPQEFWREVVDSCARETPDCLLLAEAFWMMEGYFVRTLGMHRVYNSAFMNMLREKENKKYRDTIKNTQEFDKDILKRYVNFMNNPDEETAANQFGKDDHYIGVCTLMSTLPGLPMFGHGQVEGFSEKYGMEYRRAYRDETPDGSLVDRHEREIFPLLKKRYLFSGVEHFALFDVHRNDGGVDENIFAFVNGQGDERALVLFNNAWERGSGTIHHSSPWAVKHEDGSKTKTNTTIAAALRLEGGPGRYLVMKEQRSGQWFIRHSTGIHEQGLYVELDGFRTQVFMAIHEVLDADGSWTTLYERLNGRGVFNIAEAVQDIQQAELYAVFADTFGASYMAMAHSGHESTAASDFIARVQKLLQQLRASSDSLTSLANDPALEAVASTKQNKAGTKQKKTAAEEELPSTLAQLCQIQVQGVLEILALLAKRHKDSSTGTADLLQCSPNLGYCLLVTIAANALLQILSEETLRSLGLTRKLRESIHALGITDEAAFWCVEAGLAAAQILAAGSIAADTESGTASTTGRLPYIKAILAREQSRNLLGIHSWDGINWFNKENFGCALAFAASLYACPVLLPGRKTRKKAAALLAEAEKSFVQTMQAEAQAAGWNLDVFLKDYTI
ncbi:MAG: alpha-amylase [Spirochaetes bacterium]|nr:alpha-amylase [Spirochaetota bacterium]MBU0956385.1 alpha-amylase [Spirochaetota bacterium]